MSRVVGWYLGTKKLSQRQSEFDCLRNLNKIFPYQFSLVQSEFECLKKLEILDWIMSRDVGRETGTEIFSNIRSVKSCQVVIRQRKIFFSRVWKFENVRLDTLSNLTFSNFQTLEKKIVVGYRFRYIFSNAIGVWMF